MLPALMLLTLVTMLGTLVANGAAAENVNVTGTYLLPDDSYNHRYPNDAPFLNDQLQIVDNAGMLSGQLDGPGGGFLGTISGSVSGSQVAIYAQEAGQVNPDSFMGTVSADGSTLTGPCTNFPSDCARPAGSSSSYPWDAVRSKPTVTSVSPRSGAIKGGTLLRISGHGFTHADQVCFSVAGNALLGGCVSLTTANVASDSVINVRSPNVFADFKGGFNSRTYDVRVSAPGPPRVYSDITPADRFTAEVKVTGLSPAVGPIKGGTLLTVRGSGFTGANELCFYVPANHKLDHCHTLTAGQVVSDTTIRFRTDSFFADFKGHIQRREYDVRVGVGDPRFHGKIHSAVTPADRFVAEIKTTGVSPRSGPINGGTLLTVTGVGFTGADELCFRVPKEPSIGQCHGLSGANVLSDTRIRIRTRSFFADFEHHIHRRVYDVVVGLGEKGFHGQILSAKHSTDQFTAGINVTSVSPSSGPAHGGTVLTIRGSGFTGADQICFTVPKHSKQGGCDSLGRSNVVSDRGIRARTPDLSADFSKGVHRITYRVRVGLSDSQFKKHVYSAATQASEFTMHR